MKKIIFFLFFTLNAGQPQAEQSFSLQLKASEKQKMPILLGCIGKNTEKFSAMIERIKELLAFEGFATEGFAVTIRPFEQMPQKEALKQIAKNGYSLIIFITEDQKKQIIDYRIYDTHKVAMICGKRIHTQEFSDGTLAMVVTDALWADLTSKPAVFGTKLAYCKENVRNKKIAKDIYVTSPFDKAEKKAHCFMRGGILLAPRWNHDLDNPLLLFSRCTNQNVSLLSATMDKMCRVVSNFDGLNMLPAFSPNGEQIVYCLSLEGRSQLYSCEYDQKENRKILRRITNNNGNNLSPSVSDKGDIVFCSDYKTGKPEIFYYHATTKTYECIAEGFCSSPQWCEANKKIAYSKAVDSYMQLFVYDIHKKEHKQLTFDAGDKEESSWSPCGNYLAYCVDTKKNCRIAVMNVLSHEHAFITPANERCTYPCWSPNYNQPFVLG